MERDWFSPSRGHYVKREYNKSADKSAISFFKQIPNYSKYYADFEGNIYSSRRARLVRLKPYLGQNGYYQVTLVDDSGHSGPRYIHQLMLETFVGPRPEGLIACHTPDPSKNNNRADNLAWQTRAENWEDFKRDKTPYDTRKKLDADQVREIRVMSRDGVSNASIARKFGVGPDNIRMIMRGEIWSWLDADL